jgi:hypothetical protein
VEKLGTGTGLAGFGCGTILVFAMLLPFALGVAEDSARPVVFVAVVALLAGLVAARYGDRVFEFLLRIAGWIRWW